jgi:predicted RNA-binding protein with EMAP domain
MADTSQYKVGIVLSVDDRSSSGKKALKVCSVNIGEDGPITVVTNASNVREGSR